MSPLRFQPACPSANWKRQVSTIARPAFLPRRPFCLQPLQIWQPALAVAVHAGARNLHALATYAMTSAGDLHAGALDSLLAHLVCVGNESVYVFLNRRTKFVAQANVLHVHVARCSLAI